MRRLFVALLAVAIQYGAAQAMDRDSIVGIYAVDFSGGKQPDNVVLATLTQDGKFLTVGMSGTYKLDGTSLTISLPDEPAPEGKVSESKDGFLLEANVEGHQLVHKYTRLTAVTNVATQVHGQWTALYDSYQTAPAQPPTRVPMNLPVTFLNGVMTPGKEADGHAYKPQKYKTKTRDGECHIWFEDDKGGKSEVFLAYAGGPYLCFVQKDTTKNIKSAKVHLRKGSSNQ
jgi:hypothetical protein